MSFINLVRVAPAYKASGTVSANVNGRPYSCAVGSTIDVPSADADALEARGAFIKLGPVGTTAQRPAYPPNVNSDPRIAANPINTDYVDTTVGAAIVYNGAAWINAVTGAVV